MCVCTRFIFFPLLFLVCLAVPSCFPSVLFGRCLAVILRVRSAMRRHTRNGSTVPALFAQVAAKHPDKPALVCESTGEVSTPPPTSSFAVFVVVSLTDCFFAFQTAGLDLPRAAAVVQRRGPLGTGSGLGREHRGGPVHGELPPGGGPVAGVGHGRSGGGAHQLQPATAVVSTLHRRVWSSSSGGWVGDDGG